MIVCVAGLPGSGKSTVAKLLKKRGFELVEMGDLVREKMKEKKIPITPDSIKKYAIAIRAKYGKGIVAKYAMLKVKEVSQKKDVAIIGIRSMQELAAFRKKFKGIKIIAVVAPTKQRYERLVKRSWANDPKNFAKFEERERQERVGYAKHGKRTEGVLSLVDNADYLICNTENFVRLSKDMNILTAKLRHLE